MTKPLHSRSFGAAIIAAAAVAGVSAARAEDFAAQQVRTTPQGTIVTPGSSIQRPEDRGVAAHTNFHIFVPKGGSANSSMPSGKYENPPSLACVYGLTTKVTGCNPETLTTVATGGSKIVAIVDAFDDPTAEADLKVFSSHYGLPAITKKNFEVAYASGTKPAQDSSGGWELEESLDVDMAHALAPDAKVVLVEAASNSFKDLFAAVKFASALVAKAGGGEVSNSWSGGEFSGEESDESTFTGSNVVFFASAGDSSGVGVPAALSNVVSVGGTSINRSASGVFMNQTTWTATGGGLSAYVKTPPYQSKVTNIVHTSRGVPDVSLVANPSTGVWIYDTTPYQGTVFDWVVLGGTSVSSPAIAALVNNAGAFNASSVAELTEVYANLGVKANFTDITKGSCPNAASGKASKGYDLCTGVGTPLGKAGK